MKTLAALLFILVAAECLSKFFYSSKKGVSPMTLLIFMVLAPTALDTYLNSSANLTVNTQIAAQFLAAILPLVAAALMFAALQALLSMSVSKEISDILRIFRPVWLVGFVILVVRNLTPLAAAVLVEAPRP